MSGIARDFHILSPQLVQEPVHLAYRVQTHHCTFLWQRVITPRTKHTCNGFCFCCSLPLAVWALRYKLGAAQVRQDLQAVTLDSCIAAHPAGQAAARLLAGVGTRGVSRETYEQACVYPPGHFD